MDEDGDIAGRRVILRFSCEATCEPILNNIRQQFKMVTNIIEPGFSDISGWVTVEFAGDDQDIENAISWATSMGVWVYLLPDDGVSS